MRLAIIGDTHLGRKLMGYDVTPYIRDVMYQFLELCDQINATHAVHLGDLFDKPRPSLKDEKIALQWCNEFERRRIKLYIIAGNHDVASNPAAASALEPIKVAPFRYVRAVDRPLFEEGLLFLPFPSPALYTLDAAWSDDLDYALADMDGQVLAFAHLNIDGAVIGEQEWVYRGGNCMLPMGIIDDPHIRTYSGHIHHRQEVEDVRIVGAAQRLRFSERNNELAFVTLCDKREEWHPYAGLPMLQLELDASKWAIESHPTTATALKYIDEVCDGKDNDCDGKIVKVVRYVDDRTQVDWLDVQKAIYANGALFVMMAPVVRATTAVMGPPMSIGEPLKVAAGFIRTKLPGSGSEEKKEIYKRFKKIHRILGK